MQEDAPRQYSLNFSKDITKTGRQVGEFTLTPVTNNSRPSPDTRCRGSGKRDRSCAPGPLAQLMITERHSR